MKWWWLWKKSTGAKFQKTQSKTADVIHVEAPITLSGVPFGPWQCIVSIAPTTSSAYYLTALMVPKLLYYVPQPLRIHQKFLSNDYQILRQNLIQRRTFAIWLFVLYRLQIKSHYKRADRVFTRWGIMKGKMFCKRSDKTRSEMSKQSSTARSSGITWLGKQTGPRITAPCCQ